MHIKFSKNFEKGKSEAKWVAMQKNYKKECTIDEQFVRPWQLLLVCMYVLSYIPPLQKEKKTKKSVFCNLILEFFPQLNKF
jgi:hypothetical protein